MFSHLEEQKQGILDAVLKLAASRLPQTQRELAQGFIRDYYGQMDVEDMQGRELDDLYGAAMAHFSFGQVFAGGMPKLRVYNPRLEEHGWTSPHTVIEIVNDDMPFLVDSITMEVNRLGCTLHLLIHPLFRTRRDKQHQLQELAGSSAGGETDYRQESFIHVEVDRATDPARLKALGDGMLSVLADVRAAVEDWHAMKERMRVIIDELRKPPACLAGEEVAEGKVFLEWVNDDHFTFLGYRDYELATVKGEDQLRIVPHSGLGILREPREGGISTSFAELPAGIRKLARDPRLLVLIKANTRATVHRPGYLDYIGVKRFDGKGKVLGERRFVGLYTSSAYHARPSEIPLLRNKVANVLAQAGFPPTSHMGKNLVAILERYPRDELFQMDDATLLETSLGILRLGDRRKTRVFIRRDIYGRFYSCLIFLPRENYNTELRTRIQDILKRALHGSGAEFTVLLSDEVLARIHMLIRTAPGEGLTIDARDIEAEIVLAMRDWADDLKLALLEHSGEETGNRLMRIYGQAFPVAYRENISARAALHDIEMMESLSAASPVAMSLYRPVEADGKALRLRVYRRDQPLPLSGSLPMLENMGVSVHDEQSYTLECAGQATVHIHDFGMFIATRLDEISGVKPLFEEVFHRVLRCDMENDGFNRLVLAAGLSGDEVVMLRALAKYLRQTGFTFSQSYIEQTLAGNAGIARLLVDLFHARFNPATGGDRSSVEAALVHAIELALDAVANADEDRILRRFLAVVMAMIRTNYYQSGEGGAHKPYVSFKLVSAKVPELPEPRPLYEVWVYSPRMEGIHLRGGKVARGGIRWSDRMEDFRTEVLGLVKAQMVKNAVIVPVGSKGGFVVKNPPPQTGSPADREALMKEGIECYKTLLRGLLDVTDNLVSNKLVPPRDVVRHDGDDAYLVVAADKGTATFSDIANAVSAEYRHWLGDAFASGGSVGYDHKKMGITARGAWESVKRHFLEIGIDTQTTDFTVVGVGDMSGDVFGNGMLLSRHIKLLAAFDHRHIFLDPAPEVEASFKERERLFNLPRSSWDDYDKALISEGGGVHARSVKAIAITPEVKQALDIAADTLTPVELIRAILQAPVDLFYNGGIGTYVKASSQSNAQVGDRATDALRIDGRDLHCKAVVEGGNLGCTQLGRIEYALGGGRINTDAIDNSAGVDCSDHEVNIKILLGIVEADGELTEKQRNQLLAGMTGEVAELVLADNYYQTQSLSVSGSRGGRLLDAQASFIRSLEKMGRLNRSVEFLPNDEQIAERRAAKIGLTSPERAVLLAYSKMVLCDQLVASDLVDDDYFSSALIDYFPRALRERYAAAMSRHPLKREIIATVVANSMINHVGSVFVHRMQEETGAAPHEVVRAYTLVRDIFGLSALWSEIEALDGKIPAQVQNDMLIDAGRLLLRAVLWFLRRRQEKMANVSIVELFSPGVRQLRGKLQPLLHASDLEALTGWQARLQTEGVPAATAEHVASLDALYAVLDIVEVAAESKQNIDLVAAVYFALTGKLEMRWFADRIAALPSDTHWQALARNAMRDDLSSLQRHLAAGAIKLSATASDASVILRTWEQANTSPLTRLMEILAELKSGPALDLAMLSVVLRELRGLA
ncbi:MAG: NAD-glutamate dehydrogenase [Betaproteobacteria bacterium]|nr:NAD-glutamate dehydrogenase [Betaproteobacteria bacterium]